MSFGMFHVVTLLEECGKVWTSDGILAKTADIKPLSDLIGREVSIGNHKGTIKQFLSDNSRCCSGKYLGEGRYAFAESLQCFNSQVGVFWHYIDFDDGMPQYWNHFETLKLNY